MTERADPRNRGARVNVRLPPELVAKIETFMSAYNIDSRSSAVRALLERGYETTHGDILAGLDPLAEGDKPN